MEIATRLVRLAAVFALPALVISLRPAHGEVPTPDPRLYINVNYQFSVELPRGYPACVSEHTNHGVEILLNHQAGCENDDQRVSRIVVFANYNVATEAETPARLAHFECGYRVFRRIVWLRWVTLGGRKAAGCRRYLDGKKISVEISTLRKTDRWAMHWIQVGAALETTADHYVRDMQIFRRVLKTVWIHPDGPNDEPPSRLSPVCPE
jgi:hypothetical protein